MHRDWSMKINSKELASREGSEVDIKEEGFRVEGFHKNKCVEHDKYSWRDAVGWVFLTRSFLGTALTCSLFFVLLFQRGFLHLPLLSLVMKALTSIPLFLQYFFLEPTLFSWLPLLDVDAAWICPGTASVSAPLCFLSENVWSGSYFCLKYLLGKWKLRTSCQDFPFLSFFSPALVVFGQPSRSFQPWLLSIVPLFGCLLVVFFTHKKT